MIYLASSKGYGHTIRHEFYHDGYIYLVQIVQIGNFYYNYDKIQIGSAGYRTTEPFEYELPETLNIIEYNNFEERMSILNSIIEKIIFDKL